MSNPADSSGLLAASAVVMARPGRLSGLIVLTDGTNAATVTVYDNATAASGKVLAKLIVAGASQSASLNLPSGRVTVDQGIYCSISGTGAAAIVHYELG
jgi:hypothetical protein